MARISYGNFKVLNPTPFEIKAGFDLISKNGAEYNFKPFEEKEINLLEQKKTQSRENILAMMREKMDKKS